MKIFKKITILLMITSFVFYGEAFAKTDISENDKRSPTIRAKKVVDRKQYPTSTNKKVKARKPKTKANLPPKKSEKVKKVAAKSKAHSAPQKSRDVKKAAPRPKVNPTPKKSEDGKKVAAKPKAKANRASKKSEDGRKVAAKPKAKANRASRKPEGAKKAAPKPKAKTKKGPYTMCSKDIPKELRADLIKLGMYDEDEDENKKVKVTASQLRKVLAEIQEVENYSSGITKTARNYFTTRGYNPQYTNDVTLDIRVF